MRDQENREFEIKLMMATVNSELSKKLLSKAALVTAQELSATYFDTCDWSLRKGGLLLRIRTEGSQIEQTCKLWGGHDGSSRINRQEWSCPLSTANIDLKAFPRKLQSRINRLLSGKELQSYTDISTQRTSGLVAFGTSLIEVAEDQVTISAAHDKSQFSEIEMELKQGKASDVFRYILALPKPPEMHWSITSKADRGYTLAAGVPETAQKAGDIQLDPATTVTQAFRIIAWSCISHLLGNYLLVIKSRDEEALHQSRVAIRRLRSALSIFRAVVDDQLYVQLYEEWRNAAKKLGAARDLDVLIGRVDDTGSEAEKIFSAKLSDARRKRYDDACTYLRSAEFQRLLLVTAIWLEEGDWATCRQEDKSSPDETIDEFVRQYFRKMRHALGKHGTNLNHITAAQRHRLRIKMKKLGYALDFFQSVSGQTREGKAFIKAGKDISLLKDQLGALNDIVTGQHWSEVEDKPADKHGLVREQGLQEFRHREHNREKRLLTKASATLQSLQESIAG